MLGFLILVAAPVVASADTHSAAIGVSVTVVAPSCAVSPPAPGRRLEATGCAASRYRSGYPMAGPTSRLVTDQDGSRHYVVTY
jgi:hypothetical protein